MSSLKTFCLRWPQAASSCGGSLMRRCPASRAASFTTSAPSRSAVLGAHRQQQVLALQSPFARENYSSSSSMRKSSLSTMAQQQRLKPSSPFSSLTTSSRPFSSAPSSSSSSPSTSPASSLNWDTFFKLRLRRRRIQLFFSVTTGLAGGAAGAVLLAEGFAEPLVSQVPLDPFVTLGLLTFACAGLGWLIGPTLGNQVFYLVNRRFKTQMMHKESEFFARVKKHRVDPSNSSAGNPVPDFYGEKIQSVSGYRRWLKDQRAFNKKKTASFV